MGERETVELHEVEHRCHARWRNVGRMAYSERKYVRVGVLAASGRWYVELVGGADGPARLYGTDEEAYAAAQRVMGYYGGDWEQIPCDPMEEAVKEARRRAREAHGTGSQE